MATDQEEERDRIASEAEHKAVEDAVSLLRTAAGKLNAHGVYFHVAKDAAMLADDLEREEQHVIARTHA